MGRVVGAYQWSAEERQRLREWRAEGMPVLAIAGRLGRTPAAVERMCSVLGITRSRRQPSEIMHRRDGRRCECCGAMLALRNPGPHCFVCTRKREAERFRALELQARLSERRCAI